MPFFNPNISGKGLGIPLGIFGRVLGATQNGGLSIKDDYGCTLKLPVFMLVFFYQPLYELLAVSMWASHFSSDETYSCILS